MVTSDLILERELLLNYLDSTNVGKPKAYDTCNLYDT
jgi:hypothetical protein